ncbi:MAG TPA: nucleotidyltransferase family protein [Solirubrobacteraceae bacterium]|jgi:hypothetical protein|nr:nucleotidyltransferase family protein [Solirubrobacteraceae bacterium]
MDAECGERYSQLAQNFVVDALTVEVAGEFGREGIETLVLKGPVLAKWLYPDKVRPYVDSDLMVAPGNRARAAGVLERLGFVEYRPWMPTALSMDIGRTTFGRDGGMVDLHCQLPGLDGEPDAIWDCLIASAERQAIGGVELRVPDRNTVLLHVALHAAQHANRVDGKQLEDLRRALARVEETEWSRALELACAYRGVPAFTAGLRLLPEGRDLARRLDLGEGGSLKYALLREDVIAEELYALLSASVGIRRKLAIAASRGFPGPGYMRWWSALARRGKRGLACAYLWRAIWVIGQASSAVHTLWRVRRAKGEG